MPDYTTGTYIIRARKPWLCSGCNGKIIFGTAHFVRVKEYGDILRSGDGKDYRKKNYHRYHLNCARCLDDLNHFETGLLIQRGVR